MRKKENVIHYDNDNYVVCGYYLYELYLVVACFLSLKMPLVYSSKALLTLCMMTRTKAMMIVGLVDAVF